MPQGAISNGIDLKYNLNFYTDMEGNLADNPNVTATIFIELINDINPLQLEQTIKDN